MNPTLREMLELTASNYPEEMAVRYPRRDQHWSYATLDAKANQLATALADTGVRKGDRVATMLYNGTEIVLTLFACAKLGAVFTPLNFRNPSDQVEYILTDAGASHVVFEAATRDQVADARADLDAVEEWISIGEETPEYATNFYELLEDGRDTRPDVVVEPSDTYALLYTSGTTGRPKGVVYEHGSIVEQTVSYIAEGGAERSDIGLSAFPLCHAGELHGAFLPRLQLGATTVIHHDFDPERVLSALEAYGVTTMFAPPTGWNAIVQAMDDRDVDTSSFRLGIYGGGPMPADVRNHCLARFDAGFLQAYGMTELGGLGTLLHPASFADHPDSAGKPALYRDVRIVAPDGSPDDERPHGEIGEILLASPSIMRGYWNRPEKTDSVLHSTDHRDWYRTGDLGYLDADGFLYVVDRKDDMIISGGENIYPAGIEDVLFDHPDVVEAAVVGEDDPEWGERVVAYVVGDVTARELDSHVQESDAVPSYARPREYYFVDELPKNPAGKVQKFKLQDGSTMDRSSTDPS